MNEPADHEAALALPPAAETGGAARQHYLVRFREDIRDGTACADSAAFRRGDVVMVRRPHGLEPALVACRIFAAPPRPEEPDCPEILRPATEEEARQYRLLPVQEKEAYAFCQGQVAELGLPMKLARVERFFDGSKIIFYFTAENRVDFRELVKILVRQYRTRIELRQIGVRHETQMLGGLGTCGRALCCSTFLNNFDSVSIKMAKAQDLPLNPTKISGNCNRLLCCLNYEYELYRDAKRQMPKPGKPLVIGGETWQVIQQHPLAGRVTVAGPEGKRRDLDEAQWTAALAGQLTASADPAAPAEATPAGTRPEPRSEAPAPDAPRPAGRHHRRKKHHRSGA